MPPPYGGMSLQAQALLARLQRENIAVEMVSVNPLPPKIFAWVRHVPGLRTAARELQYLILIARIIPGCQIVHHFVASGLYFFAYSVPLLLLSRCLKKRLILNYRGGAAPEFLKRWGWCVVPLMRRATSICVPSEFLQRSFGKYGLSSALLPNIAQIEMFPWRERKCFAPTLLVTRNLEPMYNVACILRAFRMIQDRFPNAMLSVAGDGSESPRLRQYVRDCNLRGVRFLGAVAHSDLPALYAAHDIYVNSSNVDNFPGTLVEAACCGLPIVTTGAGGIPVMIRQRENGIMVGLDDERAMSAAVIEIVENPEFGRSLARRARNWAEQLSWKEVLSRLLTIYGGPNSIENQPLAKPEALVQ